jgi:hypothetical protein
MSDNRSGTAVGFAFFAGFMMIMVGVFDMIEGFAALFKKDFYAVTPNYVFHFNSSTWGWIHMLLGLIILLAGLGVFSGAVWARTVGVILAGIVGVTNFAFIPIYPIFSIVIVAVCIFVIWALTVHGRDMVPPASGG